MKITPWMRDTGERALRTFVQGYTSFWLVTAGASSSDAPSPVLFDSFFDVDNAKAGAVAVVFSVVMSWAAKPVSGTVSPASLVKD